MSATARRRKRHSRRELGDSEGIIMETAQGDGERAHDAGSIAERADANLHRPRSELQQHARDLVREVWARTNRATQNEQLRIYSCDDRRGCKSSEPRSLVDHVRGKRVSR